MMKAGTLSSLTAMIFVVGVFFVAHPALVQAQEACPLPEGMAPPPDPPVTAQQVEDGSASLKDFALVARGQYMTLGSTLEEAVYFQCRIRQEGSPWRSGSTYLVQLTLDGRVYEHAKAMSLAGRLLNPLIYGQILLALGVSPAVLVDLASPDPDTAAEAGAAFLNTLSQGPDAAFDAGLPGASGHAIGLADTGSPIILLAGFDLNESHLVPISDDAIDYGDPAVTAEDVVDRETLKAFVTEAGEWFGGLAETATDPAAMAKARIAMRDPNGPWRHGSVYLYAIELNSNIILFHGAFPDRFEWRPPGVSRDTVTGELIRDQIFAAAASSPEGGFWEYHFDDPADDTDADDIPKLGYARKFTVTIGRTDGTTLTLDVIVGSGFYPAPDAPPALAQEACPLPEGMTPPPEPLVTAQQVEDGSASLKDFALAVIDARDQHMTLSSPPEEVLYLQCRVRQEGSPWRSGSTYLVQLTPDGRVSEHAKAMSLAGRLLNPLIYGQILLALGVSPAVLADLASPDPAIAAEAGAAFFNTLSQRPDAAFDAGLPGASGHATVLAGTEYPIILLAGFDLDESHLVPISDESIDYGDPAVTARDVVDRETLKAFVTEAGEWFGGLVESATGPATISKARVALRDPNGPWRHGSVYLYAIELNSNIILFHGAFPDRLEWRPPGISRDAVTGELIRDQIFAAAASSPEGGFWEYHFDDPADDSDAADIPKVGYARKFTVEVGRRPDGTILTLDVIVGSGFYNPSPDVVASQTIVEATVLGDAVEGLTVEFSRAIAGRQPAYLWSALTDANGHVSLAISSAHQVSGYYQARARNASGEIVGEWHSIPLNRDRRQVLELTLGGGVRVVQVEAAKAVAASGLAPNAPNPFNSATQIAYHLSSPGPVQLVIYNILGQPVRTLVDESQAAGSYQVQWDARDQQGSSLSSGVYFSRLSYPGGMQTRRLLYLK